MFQIPDIRHQRHLKGLLAAFSLLLVTGPTFSQSGRRTKTPVTPPPTTEENAPVRLDSRDLPEPVKLLVGRQFTSRHMMSEEAIFAHFVNRLNELKNVTAVSLGDSNRDRARKRATQEGDAIVLLLQFDIDSFQKGTYILDSPDLDVRVLAYGPRSAREKFKGKVYYKALEGPMVKRDNWPGGTPIKITTEAVGIEMAEQVHDWLLVEAMRKRR